MTKLREQAMELLQDIPDDKIVYLIDIMKGLKGLSDNAAAQKTQEPKSAKGIFRQYANPDLIPKEKDAWGEAVKEKHANH